MLAEKHKDDGNNNKTTEATMATATMTMTLTSTNSNTNNTGPKATQTASLGGRRPDGSGGEVRSRDGYEREGSGEGPMDESTCGLTD